MIAQPSGFDQQNRGDEDRPAARRCASHRAGPGHVLPRVGLTLRSAWDRHGKDGRDHQRPIRSPSETALAQRDPPSRILRAGSARRRRERADERRARHTPGTGPCRPTRFLRLLDRSVTAAQFSQRRRDALVLPLKNCSNGAPVMNASVQPFFTSASFHASVACSSSSVLTSAWGTRRDSRRGRTPRQLVKVRSMPASFSVGRRSLDPLVA